MEENKVTPDVFIPLAQKEKLYQKTVFWVVLTILSFGAVGASSFLPEGSVLNNAAGILFSAIFAVCALVSSVRIFILGPINRKADKIVRKLDREAGIVDDKEELAQLK